MKIKAFTLLEMLLVLALTGLVLAISWGVYSNFYLFSKDYEKRNDLNQELALLDETLRRDCAEAFRLSGDSAQVAIQGGKKVVYAAVEAGLVRTTEMRQDSFFLLPPRLELDSTQLEYRLRLKWESKQQTYRVFRPATARKMP